MLTKKQLILLKSFQSNVFREYSFKDISRITGEKSNNALQIAIKQFIEEDLVSWRKIGNSKLYKMKIENEICYDYLTLISYESLTPEVKSSINALKKEIEKYNFFYSLVIFGSYAIGKQTRKSDLDIALIIPDKTLEKDMKIAVNMALNNSIIPLHVEIIASNDFFEMLINKQENVGKEIARKHRAIHNINIFYKIVKMANDNGFKY
ncbi:MAG: nucleotidyltransferase domain-containing protein [Nanoarchaeota archaeon]|nr:nucleotidyltransferase domain-containing protein [Nanoarchaeota archaeon]